jgi:excisionase family DNA binding protein
MEQNQTPAGDHDMTRQEAVERLGITLRTLDRRIAEGTIGATRYADRSVRVSRGDVERYAATLPPDQLSAPPAPAPLPGATIDAKKTGMEPARISLRDLRGEQ